MHPNGRTSADWQKECLQLAQRSGRRHLVYSLPTSGGKTLVAEVLSLQELLLASRSVLFVLPYVSLVQEKVRDLSPLAVDLGFLVEEYAGARGALPPVRRRQRCAVYVATIEKAHFLVDALTELGRLSELGLLVVDEVGLPACEGGGATITGRSLILVTARARARPHMPLVVRGKIAFVDGLSVNASKKRCPSTTKCHSQTQMKRGNAVRRLLTD